MSHFSVLVIGENPEEQLAPYHEFECTGRADEYVVDVDKTEESLREYAEATERRFRSPDGESVSAYDDRFYREPTEEEKKIFGPIAGSGGNGKISWSSRDWGDGQGYRTKVHFMPEGWTEVEEKPEESAAEWIADYHGWEIVKPGQKLDLNKKHKYGYLQVDKDGNVVKCIDRTNPNAKWDWYELGGRWRGFFRMKEMAPTVLGEPGLGEYLAAQRGEEPKNHHGMSDCGLKRDIDFAAMRRDAANEAGEQWDKAHAIIQDRPFRSWDEIRDSDEFKGNIDGAREAYGSQDVIKDWNASREFGFFDSPSKYLIPRERYCANAALGAFSTYAVVKDGQWFEKGSMGWFGISVNEKDQAEWDAQLGRLIDELPDDTMLSVYDCHI